MGDFCLALPTVADEEAMKLMMREWHEAGGRINPGLLKRYAEEKGFSAWLDYLETCADKDKVGDNVPQTLYFIKNGCDIIGAIAVRHYLNESNTISGGHVAYGIRPTCRGKGYGHIALKLAVAKLNEMGITKILVTCDADNLASERVILRAGGVMENQAYNEDGILMNRYWIG